MATLLTSNSYAANSGDNTTFRAYGTAVSNAFANAGWVQTSDTGQINWTTVVANGTTGVYSGSEIWRMNDALANVAPVYIKIDYGTSGSTNRPSICWTVGHSSNGTLGLCGALSVNNNLQMSAPGPTLHPCYFTGSPNYIGIAMWLGTSYVSIIGIERTHDANGNDTPEGCILLNGLGTAITHQYWNIFTGAGMQENLGTFFSKPSSPGFPQGAGTIFNWAPIYPSKGIFLNPSLLFICGTATYFGGNTLSTVTHYNNTHTYVGLKNAEPVNRSGISTSSVLLSMRWE
jgi:hypothetical protein